VVAEAAASDQADVGVDLLDSGVAEFVANRRLDCGALVAHRSGELDERRQARSPGPLHPGVEDRDRFVGVDAVDLPELLLEQVGAVQALVDLGDRGELELLAGREALGVLPQRKARALQIAGERDVALATGLV
jgi:hypothetical protein